MSTMDYLDARSDFRRARRRATMESLLARLKNQPSQLLSYEEVCRIAGAQGELKRGLREIPIDNIVGSVGRHADFTRTFLPRYDSLQERWVRVMALADSLEGWPPIEVYQMGEAYFVIDGHHRVSAARQMGLATFPAYVIETRARIPVKADDDLQQLVVRMEQQVARQTPFTDAQSQPALRATPVTTADAKVKQMA